VQAVLEGAVHCARLPDQGAVHVHHRRRQGRLCRVRGLLVAGARLQRVLLLPRDDGPPRAQAVMQFDLDDEDEKKKTPGQSNIPTTKKARPNFYSSRNLRRQLINSEKKKNNQTNNNKKIAT
jgi:hypothetical protein